MPLDFLGLEQEAVRLFIGCIILGLALGALLGALSGYGKNTNNRASTGQIVFLVICIVVGIAGLIIGAIPGILLFFTFQWKTIFIGLVQGVIAAVPPYFIAKSTVRSHRRRKYMRNPIIKEAVAYCKQKGIVGIQCFADRLRYFKAIENPGYCKNDMKIVKRESAYLAKCYQEQWSWPDSWVGYENAGSFAGELKFSDRGYPRVPDLPMFASALAKKLGGFDYAEHNHSVQHDTVTYGGNTKTTTHNIVVLHNDCFVFSRTAYRKAKKEWKRLGLDQPIKEEKPVKTEAKTWE